MKVNVNQPSFIAFLESITNSILSVIKIDDYFVLNAEKKLAVSFTVLNLLKNSAKIKANFSDMELKTFITVLCKKNEEIENYEFAAVLNDVIKNFDAVNEITNSAKKTIRQNKKSDVNSSQPPYPPQQ
jgi:hypothetical protein